MPENKHVALPNGDTFDGILTPDGLPLSGVYKYKSGDIYVGTMLDERPHGQGKVTFADGGIYEGTWVFGQMVGNGKFRVEPQAILGGTVFSGRFGRKRKVGAPDPHSALTDSLTYRGLASAKGWVPLDDDEFALGERLIGHTEQATGEGKIEYPDGRVFQGTWEYGRPTKGYLYVPGASEDPRDVDVYTGDCSARGHGDGKGRLECFNGDVFEGDFSNGVPSGCCRVLYDSGDVYEGTMSGGLRDGQGVLRLRSGDLYKGGFSGGECSGRGCYISAGGDVFDGFFHAGAKHGRRVRRR